MQLDKRIHLTVDRLSGSEITAEAQYARIAEFRKEIRRNG